MNDTSCHRAVVAALVGFALAAGCRTPRESHPENAVLCPRCETVWIEMTDFDDPYRMTTVETEVMRCPDCESAVAHFFETGELEHACATCGELKLCRAHD